MECRLRKHSYIPANEIDQWLVQHIVMLPVLLLRVCTRIVWSHERVPIDTIYRIDFYAKRFEYVAVTAAVACTACMLGTFAPLGVDAIDMDSTHHIIHSTRAKT